MAKISWRSIDGIVLLDKPAGLSSNHALQKVRRLFQAKKAGHTGTLDPMATGMLPIAFGRATKFIQFMLESDKCYVATIQLGQLTTTGDREGQCLDQQPVPMHTQAHIERVLSSFIGPITQTPPMYSALKYQGKPLYYWARRGIEVPQKSRQIEIKRLIVRDWQPDTARLVFEVNCSKGTYVRTLAEDIAKQLATVGHLIALRRQYCAGFSADQMHSWSSIEYQFEAGELLELLLPVDAGLQHWPAIEINSAQFDHLRHGRKQQVQLSIEQPGWYRLFFEGTFVGIVEYDQAMVSVKMV